MVGAVKGITRQRLRKIIKRSLTSYENVLAERFGSGFVFDEVGAEDITASKD